MNLFKIIKIISRVSAWLDKALEDGKITLEEAFDLIAQIGDVLELPLDFDIPGLLGNVPAQEETPAEDE